MLRQARISALCTSLTLALADLALAQAGSGSGSFGGGGGGGGGFSGGGGGGFSGGGGSGSSCTSQSCETAGLVVVLLFFGAFGALVLWLVLRSVRYRIKVNRRVAKVRRASAEAAEDDPYFAADDFVVAAEKLFREAQQAWDDRDRARLAELVGKDLLVEWNRRLDDFDRKGWHNRVEVLGVPEIQYVGITNREPDEQDRAVVRITAQLRAYVIGKNGRTLMRKGSSSEIIKLIEYWTLARRDDNWMVVSIEQKAEGDHHLDEEIVASPWSAGSVADEALTEVAVADKLPEGFTTADLADFNFADDARAKALDLSLADARFMPAVLEAAARRAVGAWAEAVDGDDAELDKVAGKEAIDRLLYAGDTSRTTRLVVRGPRVKQIRIERVDVEHEPATMTVAVELGGRRYVENRDTTTVVSGDKDNATTFTERWTLALDGPDAVPWRLMDAAG